MKMIEFGELPRDDFVLINKIENILGISLRKEKKEDTVTLHDLQKMNEEKAREEIEKACIPEEKKENISGDDIEILDD